MSRAVAEFIYRFRWSLAAFCLLGAAVLAPRANITNIDNDLTAWFSRSDPIYQEYERFQREFGGTRNLIIALQAPDRARMFSEDTFTRLRAMTEDIERVQAVDRVTSLATATVVDARPATSPDEDDVLDVRPLIDDLGAIGPEAVGQRALDDDMLRGDLISDDGRTTAIIVMFDETRIDDVRADVITAIKSIVEARAPPGFARHFNGSLEISEEYNRITLANQERYTPPILLLTLIALYLMFRSWRRTLLTMFAVSVSIVWTLGLYSLLGFNYNVLSSMIVPLVVVLAVADDVHIVQHFDAARRRGSARDAFISTVEHLMAPLLGASGTTALGMASLATSNVVAVREFGLGAAVGVMVDFFISLALVPTLLAWVKPEMQPPPQESWFKKPLLAVGRFSVRNARGVAMVSVVIAVLALAGVWRLRVDTNHINFFSTDHPLSQSAHVIDTQQGGIYTFQVLLEGQADSLRQPDAIRRLESLEQELRALPFVRKVTGLPDYVKRVHAELGDGTSALPTSADVIAQELFVFTMPDEGRREIDRIAASDFSKTQITVKLASMSSDVVFEQIQVASGLAERAFAGSGITPTVTGSGRLFSTLDHYLVVSQISSFATAFVTVFAVIFVVFRSWRFGVLAIIPNLLPVLVVFGTMGWVGISLNVATIMLASVALGIVDDDTIHFISRYRRETRAGLTESAAIELAVSEEARASLTTAVINSLAFAVLAFSPYKPTAWFGSLLALTMVAAFLAEIFILPAAITLVPSLFGADRVHGQRPRGAA